LSSKHGVGIRLECSQERSRVGQGGRRSARAINQDHCFKVPGGPELAVIPATLSERTRKSPVPQVNSRRDEKGPGDVLGHRGKGIKALISKRPALPIKPSQKRHALKAPEQPCRCYGLGRTEKGKTPRHGESALGGGGWFGRKAVPGTPTKEKELLGNPKT